MSRQTKGKEIIMRKDCTVSVDRVKKAAILKSKTLCREHGNHSGLAMVMSLDYTRKSTLFQITENRRRYYLSTSVIDLWVKIWPLTNSAALLIREEAGSALDARGPCIAANWLSSPHQLESWSLNELGGPHLRPNEPNPILASICAHEEFKGQEPLLRLQVGIPLDRASSSGLQTSTSNRHMAECGHEAAACPLGQISRNKKIHSRGNHKLHKASLAIKWFTGPPIEKVALLPPATTKENLC
ncbi:hypothetical protein VP01_2825g2 [Puccinia sorghi]|uniref:Uncharacterized protein n=1 Tax=Puccinia sorghi TaxID=27349 RepID=A0A0L6V427_9BASI|nr:hypothetical protein VP01_2825g2 [Puccinia sorghi]